MGELHARLGPSNHRWPNCPGSPRVEADYPDTTNEYAVDGTGSHLLLEMCLRTNREDVRAEEWLDLTIGEGHVDKVEGWYIKQDRCDRVQVALDYVARRRGEIIFDLIETEEKSDPGSNFSRDDWWGTVDIHIYGTDRVTGETVVEVIDFKDGRGYVSEKNNTQLISYAGGKIGQDFPYSEAGAVCVPKVPDYNVRMTIIQPKTFPAIRYEDKMASEVWFRIKELAMAAHLTDDPNAPLIASTKATGWCQWCSHKGACTASTEQAMEGVALMSDTTEGNNSIIDAIQTGQIAPETMTDDKIAAILDAAPLIKKMIEKVEEEAQRRLESGTLIPRYAMGTGRGSRVWGESEDIVFKKIKGMSLSGKRLKKDELYIAKFITPAAACKLDGLSEKQKSVIESMIKSKPGKPKVVSSNTQAPTDAQEMFGEAPKTKAINFMSAPK